MSRVLVPHGRESVVEQMAWGRESALANEEASFCAKHAP